MLISPELIVSSASAGHHGSVRVSLANLDDEDYEVGAYMPEVAEEYLEAWHAGKVGRHFKVIPLPSLAARRSRRARKLGKKAAKVAKPKSAAKATK
ncbi:MAG: hypothetical protein ABW205_13350 [Burkholderiales bacterium]